MWRFVVYFVFVLVLVAAVLIVSYLFGPTHSERAVGAPYEGGIVSEGSAHVRLSVRCYMVRLGRIPRGCAVRRSVGSATLIYLWGSAGWIGRETRGVRGEKDLLQWSLSGPDITGLVRTADADPMNQTVRRGVVLSRLEDLIRWGRKNFVWPFTFRALLLLRGDGHKHHQQV